MGHPNAVWAIDNFCPNPYLMVTILKGLSSSSSGSGSSSGSSAINNNRNSNNQAASGKQVLFYMPKFKFKGELEVYVECDVVRCEDPRCGDCGYQWSETGWSRRQRRRRALNAMGV